MIEAVIYLNKILESPSPTPIDSSSSRTLQVIKCDYECSPVLHSPSIPEASHCHLESPLYPIETASLCHER